MDGVESKVVEVAWREPVEVLAAYADEPFAFGLLDPDGWSYVGRRPTQTLILPVGDGAAKALRGLQRPFAPKADAPPFRGGIVGLAAYELGAVFEPSIRQARTGWPDLIAGRYDAVLAFDGAAKRAFAVGPAAQAALAWLAAPAAPRLEGSLANSFDDLTGADAYAAAVAQVVAAIERGDLFQANIARRWAGALVRGATPFDVFRRLVAQSPAPFGAYFRSPGRAVVSNSPERFLQVSTSGISRAQPIKGTRPRGAAAAEDRALAADLLASAKDRAENRMIVDLMRNDLSRVCMPGSVGVEAEFALESYANVHHLVSTVTGRLAGFGEVGGRDAFDLFAAAFPPGSVTGAPKVQAMIEIARHEAPRGPYCGSVFWAGGDGAFDSSVLIRTLAFEAVGDGWRFEARAGAGITADSDPQGEAEEAQVKIAAIRKALTS